MRDGVDGIGRSRMAGLMLLEAVYDARTALRHSIHGYTYGSCTDLSRYGQICVSLVFFTGLIWRSGLRVRDCTRL
jgi:hypothetical protein